MSKLLVSSRGEMKNASSGLLEFLRGSVGKTFHCGWQVFWQPAFLPPFRRLKQRLLPLVTHRQWERTKMGGVINLTVPPSLFGIYISHIMLVSTTRPIRMHQLRNSGPALSSR